MKDVVGYEGLYAVTSCGKVWSYKLNRFLKPHYLQNKHIQVTLNGKFLLIHRLVAQAYIPNPNNYDTVDHIDGNPKNNCVNNLQWLTRTQNTVKGKRNYIPKIKCIEDGNIFETQTECANYYGINCGNLNHVLKGKLKTTGKRHFCYI